jgi:hypothetical protein
MSPGPQYPVSFCESLYPVGDVVKRGHNCDGIELPILEWQGGGVINHHIDISPLVDINSSAIATIGTYKLIEATADIEKPPSYVRKHDAYAPIRHESAESISHVRPPLLWLCPPCGTASLAD